MISGPPTPPPGTPGNSGNPGRPGPSDQPPGSAEGAEPPSPPPSAAEGAEPPGPPPPPSPPTGPRGPVPPDDAPRSKRQRDRLPWLVAGVLAAVLAAICCLGGALILFDRRTNPHPPERSPVPSLPATTGQPMPSQGPSGSAGSGGNPLARALSR